MTASAHYSYKGLHLTWEEDLHCKTTPAPPERASFLRKPSPWRTQLGSCHPRRQSQIGLRRGNNRKTNVSKREVKARTSLRRILIAADVLPHLLHIPPLNLCFSFTFSDHSSFQQNVGLNQRRALKLALMLLHPREACVLQNVFPLIFFWFLSNKISNLADGPIMILHESKMREVRHPLLPQKKKKKRSLWEQETPLPFSYR